MAEGLTRLGPDFLRDGGAMGALIRAYDWSTTSLGPPEAWPQSLQTALNILLNSKHQMFLAWGPELISFYNDAYRPVLGSRHPEALARPFSEVWADIWPAISPLVNQALSGEGTWSEDLPLVTFRNGFEEIACFTFSYSPIRDESGAVAGMFCACTETTRKVQAEATPQRIGDRFGNVLESTTDCVLMTDRSWRLTYLNGRALQEISGGRDLLGMNLWEAFPGAVGDPFWDLSHQVMAERVSGAMEGFFAPLNSWYEVGVHPLEDGVAVFFRNITERKHAQAEITFQASLLDSVEQAVMATDLQGEIVYYNKFAERLYGWSAEEALGQNVVDLVSGNDPNNAAEMMAFLANGGSWAGEFIAKHRDGSRFPAYVTDSPIYDASGVQIGIIGISYDITDRKETEARLILQDRSLSAIAQGVVITDALLPDNPITYVNPAFERLTGYSAKEVIGQNCRFLQGAETAPEAVTLIRDAIRAGQNLQTMLVNHRKDRTSFINELTISPIRDQDGRITHFVGTQADITDRHRLQERLHLALSAGRMVVWERDLASGAVERTANSIDVLGIDSGPDSNFFAQVEEQDRSLVDEFLETVNTTGSGSVEFRYLPPGERGIWLSAHATKSGPSRITGVMVDITDRKKAEEEVWRAANHDPLTGLPNRLLFHRCLSQALANAKQNGTTVSLLLIDLDDFKDINDSLGHDMGDAFLKETASRLSLLKRDCDLVAHLGGDEFVLMLVEPLVLANAARLAEFTNENLREPFTYAGRTFVSRASIGVAAFPDHGNDPAELVKAADIALHRAKQQGRNRVVTYSSAMRVEIEEKVSLATQVRDALTQGQIIPFYQPKVCLSTGKIMGFEALARWHHPTKGILTPQYFGATFVDQDIAAGIGESLITRVAMDMRLWLDRGLDIGRVAVNVSSAEFDQPGLAMDILETLARHNIPTSCFEVEVTETVLLGRSASNVAATLNHLKQHGVQIALDDFGTGYASLTHLKQFPVDHVKIDQSFVRDMQTNREDEVIIDAVIGLGKNLGLQITAEGVETEAQAQRLRELGCHSAQGYHFAKPMAASQVSTYIETLTVW